MIKVLYFASLKERLGKAEDHLDWQPEINHIAALKKYLAQRGGPWQHLQQDQVMAAINQEMADEQATIKDGDEIAFFPPVTGG